MIATIREIGKAVASRTLVAVTVAMVHLTAVAETPSTWKHECLGYFSIALPGDFEYGLIRVPIPELLQGSYEFSRELPAWHSDTILRFVGDPKFQPVPEVPSGQSLTRIYITSRAAKSDLAELVGRLNAAQEAKRAELLDRFEVIDSSPQFAKDIDADGSERRSLRARAKQVPLYKMSQDGLAYYLKDGSSLTFYAMFDERIVASTRTSTAAPDETIRSFFKHYYSRANFEVPASGVCVPHANVTEAELGAYVSHSLRLKDYPDIIISLEASSATAGAENPNVFLRDALDPGVQFLGIDKAELLDKVPTRYRSVEIAGNTGLSMYALLSRKKASGPNGINNPASKNRDWGYIAYAPGNPQAAAGTSYNLTLKIERFSRFAKTPMTESQFRELVGKIVAGIKRRSVP